MKAWLTIGLLTLFACKSSTTHREEGDFDFDGSCIKCHTGLSAKQVHPTFKLRCVDCHGGNDQVAVSDNAAQDPSVFRNPDLIARAHVAPKKKLARFFWANGIDDDGDGEVDEGPEFSGDGTSLLDFGEVAEPGLHGEGIGEFIDSELNRDLNYTRWQNPGDLRVATMTCGSGSRTAGDGGGGSVCHQSVVDSMRRSIMVNQAAVINGAYYGNESWRDTFTMARDAAGKAFDPRAGAFGYTLDYGGIDACIVKAPFDVAGRTQPTFDSECLEKLAAKNDAAAKAGAPGNAGLPAFEATQGVIEPAPGTPSGATRQHQGAAKSRYTWGGKPLLDPRVAVQKMQPPPSDELASGIPDPVDLVLRAFRAYYPLNYPGSTTNFNFTFGTSILPEIAKFKTQNPYGRSHSSGCTSCHMKYNYSGSRDPQTVVSVVDGKRVEDKVIDPTTKHREFDPAKDIQQIDGQSRLVGRTVKAAETEATGQEQQRAYSAQHQLNTRVDTDQCGLCHGFVTRINMAYQGMAEDEQRDALARHKPIEFSTPRGTMVRILDSWIREETNGGDTALVIPDGDTVAKAARARNQELADKGLLPGAGGCAANVFTEDCNNNGELDTALTLTRRDETGKFIAQSTINEDQNGNGILDLIDHAPREQSVDGRQMRYVYGGENGSTRQMDIHFERGMHCIDCHMLQDMHGDGHIYSTNWDAIEIECEDCHGATSPATLFTSGPNGGNDLRGAKDHDGRPYFEKTGDSIVQRSRVTPGVFWKVPQIQTGGGDSGLAKESHGSQHLPVSAAAGAHNSGSTFSGAPGASPLVSAKLECYSCHTSWVHNCMGCHYNVNLGDKVRSKVNADGSIEKVAGDNEVWFNNKNQAGGTNFQLLSFLRSPFVLGTNAGADGSRLAPFRSSMQVHVTINDSGGDTLFDNITFTTFQQKDANSQREFVATSGAAMNQTMPHTVRPKETKGCETCHPVVDKDGRIQNEVILAETYGLGAGRYPYIGDWTLAAGTGGLEMFETKQERELAGFVPGASTRFPGIIFNPADRTLAQVEPIFDGGKGIAPGSVGTDVALIRNFTATPTANKNTIPTLRDLAVSTVQNGGNGFVVISDVSRRGHPTLANRPSVSSENNVFVLPLPGTGHALAHIGPDVSDPFVYVADGSSGLSVVEIIDAPTAAKDAASVVATVAIPGNKNATEVTLAGDIAYVGTAEGSLEVFDISVPDAPLHQKSVELGGQVNGLVVAGFMLYAATDQGIAILTLDDPFTPTSVPGATEVLAVTGFSAKELEFSDGHLYVAAGNAGVLDIDVTVPASPQNLGDLVELTDSSESVNAADVVVSKTPGQTWVLALSQNGDLVGLKLDGSQSLRERCFPNIADCILDPNFRDATIMGRDPSFDPNSGNFFAGDPSGKPFFRITRTILTTGKRMARPAYWEKISTITGRRVRDSFMPGSGVLSLPVMQRMRSVFLCATRDGTGASGWGQMGYADGDFLSQGICKPF